MKCHNCGNPDTFFRMLNRFWVCRHCYYGTYRKGERKLNIPIEALVEFKHQRRPPFSRLDMKKPKWWGGVWPYSEGRKK